LDGDEGLESLTRAHESEVWSVAFSADGQYLASANWNGRAVQLWDARTGAPLHTLRYPTDVHIAFHVAFSPDGQRLAGAAMAADRIAVIKVWDPATGREVVDEIRERRSIPFFASFAPTGRHLVREGPEHTVQVRSAETGEVVGVVGRHERQIWGIAFSPDGRRLATASNDSTVRVWGWDTARLGREQEPERTLHVPVGGYSNRVAFSANSQLLGQPRGPNLQRVLPIHSGQRRQALR
jgi:WD40 repeat protein